MRWGKGLGMYLDSRLCDLLIFVGDRCLGILVLAVLNVYLSRSNLVFVVDGLRFL